MRLAVAATKRPRVFSCIQVRKKPNMRPDSPPVTWVETAFSISSNQRTAGAISSIMRQDSAKITSGLPWRPEKISFMSMR